MNVPVYMSFYMKKLEQIRQVRLLAANAKESQCDMLKFLRRVKIRKINAKPEKMRKESISVKLSAISWFSLFRISQGLTNGTENRGESREVGGGPQRGIEED